MKPYNSEPHVPSWISALDGELLTTAELDVLDFIHWCKKHNCRTSNDRIGSFTHWKHKTVEKAVQKLYQLDLIAIDNYGKRTRVLKPVPWADREQWKSYRKLQAKSKTDPGALRPHIPILDKSPPKGVSSIGGIAPARKAGRFLSRDVPSRALPCGSVGGGESPTTPEQKKPESKTTSKPKKSRSLDLLKAERSEPPTTPKQNDSRDDSELSAQELYDRCFRQCHDRQLAKELTLFKFPDADLEDWN
jgi:hypothetical protein